MKFKKKDLSGGSGSQNKQVSSSAGGGYNPGLWTSCFNLVVSPNIDTWWADCLRYMCSVERRNTFKSSSQVKPSSSLQPSPVVRLQPRPSPVSSATMAGNKPRAIISFIIWDPRRKDMRGLLAHALHNVDHFMYGNVFNCIEIDASEEMGEPWLWYPVAHLNNNPRLSMYAHDFQPLDKKALGNHFTLLQGYYTEHARLTLILKKGNERVGPHEATHIAEPSSARRQRYPPHKPRLRNQLVLAYKSFEESTDPTLLAGWVRWSGAWEAYTLLQDRKLCVSSITLYVRESSVPPDVFKYVVLLEVETTCPAEVQQLRAATQRLRVERWSGYTCLYTLYTLTEFADSFTSNDSISKIVGDIM